MSTTGGLATREDALSVFHSPDVVDLCAGPGGWDEGVRHLGIHPLGIEYDEIACETATLAGHARVLADISALNPKVYMGARGLIASPPCQGFSMAGRGDGRKDAELLLATIRGEFAIDPDGAIAKLHARMHDDRSVLVLEPLRWALALLPDWMAWEQVPTVLPIWEACADVLMALGYTVETGICSSEEYGVPQTRERAILVARSPEMSARLGPAQLAPATHSYYHRRNPTKLDEGVPPWVSMAEALSWGMTERPYFTIAAGTENGGADAAMLGGSGARASLDREIQAGRWKQRSNYSGPGKPGETAAERGLGTREIDQPSFAVTSKAFHFVPTDEIPYMMEDSPEELARVAAIAAARHEEEARELVVRTGNFSAKTRDADGSRSKEGSVPFERSIDAPAPTVTGNVGAWKIGEPTLPTAEARAEHEQEIVEFIQGNQENATRRTLDQPAPTITGGNDYGSRRWQMASAGPTARFTAGQVPRDLDVPSATITGKGTAYWTKEGLTRDEAPRADQTHGDLPDWTRERPSTTVQGDPRIAPPGHRHRGPDCCNAGLSESQFADVPLVPRPDGVDGDSVYRNGNQANAARRPLDTPAPTLHFAERANKVEWMPAGLADNPRASGVRVTVQEAAILQSFPPDYPWQGNKGDRYRQVGDAVPPMMAYAIVKAVTTLDTRQEA